MLVAFHWWMISNGFRLKRDKETQFLVYEKRNDDQHRIIDYVKSGSAATYEIHEDNEDFLIENEKFRDGRIKVSIKKYVRPDGDLKNMRDFMVIVQNQIYYSGDRISNETRNRSTGGPNQGNIQQSTLAIRQSVPCSQGPPLGVPPPQGPPLGVPPPQGPVQGFQHSYWPHQYVQGPSTATNALPYPYWVQQNAPSPPLPTPALPFSYWPQQGAPSPPPALPFSYWPQQGAPSPPPALPSSYWPQQGAQSPPPPTQCFQYAQCLHCQGYQYVPCPCCPSSQVARESDGNDGSSDHM